jgi:hypothetical protein
MQPTTVPDVVNVIERIARSHFPVTTRFVRAAWLSSLRVYALEVEAVAPLLSLHEALSNSGLAFRADVPATFLPHCTLRWTPQWMDRVQDKAWNALLAPAGDFVLRDLVAYELQPDSENARAIHRAALGA